MILLLYTYSTRTVSTGDLDGRILNLDFCFQTGHCVTLFPYFLTSFRDGGQGPGGALNWFVGGRIYHKRRRDCCFF